MPSSLRTASELDLTTQARPSPSEYALRQRITELVEKARNTGKEKITQLSVFDGIISNQVFTELMAKPVKVAFIIRPVVTHAVYYDALLKVGLKKLWQWMDATDASELDPKLVGQILKVTETAANRTIGPVVQRIQMHQKQEVTHTSGDPREVSDESPELLEQKIREAQAKLDKIKPIEIEANVDPE